MARGRSGETEPLAARIVERIESGHGAETPLSRLAVEFILVQASETRLIEELTVNRHWIAVRRGPATLPVTGFRLADHYADVFDMVRPRRPGEPAQPEAVPR